MAKKNHKYPLPASIVCVRIENDGNTPFGWFQSGLDLDLKIIKIQYATQKLQ